MQLHSTSLLGNWQSLRSCLSNATSVFQFRGEVIIMRSSPPPPHPPIPLPPAPPTNPPQPPHSHNGRCKLLTATVDICPFLEEWVGTEASSGCMDGVWGQAVVSVSARLQALVYDILPSTTAVFSYAIRSRKLSANEQFFCWCSNGSMLVTNYSNKTKRVIYSRQESLHQHK